MKERQLVCFTFVSVLLTGECV